MGRKLASDPIHRSVPKLLRLAHLFFLCFLVLLIPLNSVWDMENSLFLPWTCGLFAVTCIWMVWSWKKLMTSFFDPYGLFLLAAIMFNGGQTLLELFHLNQESFLAGIFPPNVLIRTIYFVTLALSGFHFGALCSHQGTQASVATSEEHAASGRDVRFIGWVLVAIALVPNLLALRQHVATVVDAGYFGLYQVEAATGFGAASNVIAEFLVPGALFLLAGSRRYRIGRIVSICVIGLHSLTLFYLGFRLDAFMPLIALVWVWDRVVQPIPKTLLYLGSLVTLGVLFPAIRAVRNLNGGERFALDGIVKSFQSIGNPLIAVISEIGGTMTTVAYTVVLVPRVREFDLGAGYGHALLTLLPNLFWSVHPSIARGTATHWLIWTIDPYTASHGGSLGYSFIAEAFLNFGWFGPVVLAIFGFLYGRFVNWSLRSADVAKTAAAAVCVAFFLRFARDELASVVRPLLWYCVIPYCCVLFVRTFRTRRAGT